MLVVTLVFVTPVIGLPYSGKFLHDTNFCMSALYANYEN